MSQPIADSEKGDLEQVETRSDDDSRADPRHLEKLQTNETLASVDIANHRAFKGDESDGKVAWTIKKLLASAFLSMLYTGQYHIEISFDCRV